MAFDEKSQYNFIANQFPEFYVEQESTLPILLEKYYQYLECNIISNIAISGNFQLGENIVGEETNAIAKIVGIGSTGDLFVLPQSLGFIKNTEAISGSLSDARATVTSIQLNPIRILKDAEYNIDISSVSEDFVGYYTSEFFNFLPTDIKTDLRKLIINSFDVYSSRGTENSLKWLWTAIYNNNNLEVIYPKDVLLKVSDGKWIEEKSIRISESLSTNHEYFPLKTIIGRTSGATAVVEYTKQYSVGAKVIIELFLSDIKGTFVTTEQIYTEEVDGIISTGIIESVLIGINIVDGGSNYEIGDTIDIAGIGGALASVLEVSNGRILDTNIRERGEGYFISDELDVDNSGTSGSGFSGKVATITGTRSIYINSDTIGDYSFVVLNASDFSSAFIGHNANSHLLSNSSLTFLATVDDSSFFTQGSYVTTESNSVIGTVVSIPSSTEIIYAIPSLSIQNFLPNNSSLNSIISYYANNVLVSGASATISSITNVTDSIYFGAFNGASKRYGSIGSISVDSQGVGYKISPVITAQNDVIYLYKDFQEILGEKTKTLTFNSNVSGIFEVNKRVEGQTSGAIGLVTDEFHYLLSNSSVSTIKYYTVNTIMAIDGTDIAGSDENDILLAEDGSTLVMESLEFINGETVLQLDTLRTKDISAELVSSNSVKVDVTTIGNNASVVANSFGVGSIETVKIQNFGLGYAAAPTITAPTGDNNAILTAEVGALSEYPGRYQNLDGLLDATNKIQDSYYYQDFSYVLRTDIAANIFRDDVKNFVHPSGWALFGEIAIRSLVRAGLFLSTNGAVVKTSSSKMLFEIPTQNVSTRSASIEPKISIIGAEPENPLNLEIKERTGDQLLFKIKFPDFYPEDEVTIQVGIINSDATSYYTNIVEIDNVNNAIKTNDSEYRFETSVSVNNTLKNHYSVVTGNLLNLNDRRTSGQIYQGPESNTFTSNPSISQFFDTYNTTTLNEEVGWYGSVHLAEIIKTLNTIAISSEIQFDDINIILENQSSDGIELEVGTIGAPGSLLSQSDQKIIIEQNNLQYEYDTPIIGNNSMTIHQIEDHKYYVSSANSTHFVVSHPDNDFIQEGLISTTVQHYNYF